MKSEDTKRKWPSIANSRWFTIDFDNQVMFYSHSKRGKRASQLYCFKDILGAALSFGEKETSAMRRSLSGTVLRTFTSKEPPAECRFVLHLQEKALRLTADNTVLALWWVDMFNAACMLGLNLRTCAARSIGHVGPTSEFQAAASQLVQSGTPSEYSHVSQSTTEALSSTDLVETTSFSELESQDEINGAEREQVPPAHDVTGSALEVQEDHIRGASALEEDVAPEREEQCPAISSEKDLGLPTCASEVLECPPMEKGMLLSRSGDSGDICAIGEPNTENSSKIGGDTTSTHQNSADSLSNSNISFDAKPIVAANLRMDRCCNEVFTGSESAVSWPLAEIPQPALSEKPSLSNSALPLKSATQTSISVPTPKSRKSTSQPPRKMCLEERIAADLALLQRPCRTSNRSRVDGVVSRVQTSWS